MSTNASEDKSEAVRLIKFDGDDANWHEWSVKTTALAKTKGFRNAYYKDTKPCSDEHYESEKVTKGEKAIYEANDKAYQLLIMSCSGIAFGLVNQAKTDKHHDGDAYMAWTNLTNRYAPNATSDLIQISTNFNKCGMKNNRSDPDEWFIQLDLLRHRMTAIDPAFTKKDEELIAHVIANLPNEYSEVITVVKGMDKITLTEVKAKIRAFYKRKFKAEKSTTKEKELALFAGQFKGNCRNCGKQGHKAAECRSKPTKNDKSKDGNNKNKDGVGKHIKCYNCNKFAGHLSKDCPEKRKDKDKAPEHGMFVGMCTVVYEQHNYGSVSIGPAYGNTAELRNESVELRSNKPARSHIYGTEKKGHVTPRGHSSNIGKLPPRKNFVGMCLVDEQYCGNIRPASATVTFEQCLVTGNVNDEQWLADTGATTHITTSDAGMTNVENVNVKVLVGDGTEVICRKRGDITVANGDQVLHLRNVLYTRHFAKNIVSVGQLLKNSDYSVVMQDKRLSLVNGKDGSELHFKCNDGGVLFYFKGSRQQSTALSIEEIYEIDEIGNVIPTRDIRASDVTALAAQPTQRVPPLLATKQTYAEALKTPKKPPAKATPKKKTIDINFAHDVYGHIGEAALRATLKSIDVHPTGNLRACEGCAKAKARAKAICKTSHIKATEPGERLFTDISGPYKKSIIGSNYWCLVVDQFSGKTWSFFVPRKNMLAAKVETLVIKILAAGHVVQYLRCDNAGENTAGLATMCDTYGIQIEHTAPHTPQQNGIVERKFVTIRDRACAAMYAAKFSDDTQGLLWAESVNTATRLTNSVYNYKGKCPDWLWYNRQPTLYPHLVQFGRIGYVTKRTKQRKLDEKAWKCVMIGYSDDHAGDTYRMFKPDTKKIVDTRDVKWAKWHGLTRATANATDNLPLFLTDGFGIDEAPDDPEPTVTPPTFLVDTDDPPYDGPEDQFGGLTPPQDPDSDDEHNGNNRDTPGGTTGHGTGQSKQGGNNSKQGGNTMAGTSKPLQRELQKLQTDAMGTAITAGKTRSQSRAATIDDEDEAPNNETTGPLEVHYIYNTSLASDPGEPRTYKQAMNGPERDLWMPAIKSEIANFYKREVWKRVPKSQLKGRRTLGTRWVFKKKNEQNGSVRYKARLVVKGYVQIPGVDFTDSFAPVATGTSVRVLFAIALYYKDWTIEVIDVKAAFLEANLEEAVYFDWPEGVIKLGFEGTNKVQNNCIRLNKAMYGTVQAALQWFKKLVEKLLIVGLTQSKVDPCVFFLKLKEEIVLIVAAHVDDCAIAGKQKWINWFKREFKKHFTVKELGCLKKHLGVWYRMASDDFGRYLELTMEVFVKGIADDFAVLFGRSPKLAKTPGIPGTCLSKNTGEPIHHSEYRSLVGKILYLVKKVSPVCANACRELSQHLDNPGKEQWNALERLLGYLLLSYENRVLKIRPPAELRAMDVVDSAYASNPDNRKSISAYIGTVGGGAIVSWQSKGQPIVTLSSTECEYVALADGI